MIKGIVFDLDDTLYPFEQYLESGFRAVARYTAEKYGIDPEESYAYMKILYTRYGEKEVLAKLVGQFSLESAAIIELMSVFRDHKPTIALYPGYRKILQNLANFHALGILTDGDPDVQAKKINALRIARHFKSIIYTGKYEDSRLKPNTFCYTLIARVMGVHPREVVFVADNPLIDFLGAKKAGLFTLRVLSGEFKDKSVPMEFEAHRRIKDITAVQEYINEFFQ